MAMSIPTRQDIGKRLAWLRRTAGMTGRELGKFISSKDGGIVTKLEHGQSLDYERMMEAAEGLAGHDPLVDDPRVLFDFMLWGGELKNVLRPHLRLVEDDNQPSNLSDPEQAKGGKLTPFSDLDYVSFDAAEHMKKAA